MDSFKIAETLKELRTHRELTQEQVADQLHIARQTYSNYENGTRIPSLEICRLLADFFGISPQTLIFTGLHPQNVDPFASLPGGYREMMEDYHSLLPDKQAEAHRYIKYLKTSK